MTLAKSPIAAIYVRVSTVDQNDDMQFTDLREYCKRMGWEVAEYAEKMRTAFMLSPQKAEEWVGLDFDDDRPERKELWVQNNQACVTRPELNSQLVPGVGAGPDGKPAAAKPGGDSPKPKPKKALTDEDRARKLQLKTLIHKLRLLTLKTMADGGDLAGVRTIRS